MSRLAPEARGPSRWWEPAVGYEVYIRSFADSDGDGVGDLAGVLSRLDHLADLGIDIVWVTPIYPSPMHDHGYDVADYTGVAEVFGTTADLDSLVSACHERGMRLILDLVPNHSSSEHEWFRRSRSSRDDPYRDHYIWRDSAPDGGPPNNWVSHFGGRAWTYDEATGQWWLHLFLPEQPDLNWSNPTVVEEFDGILEHWFARGVDGFRIDVAHALVKDAQLRSNPLSARPTERGGVEMGQVASTWETLEHVHDTDQPAVLDVYRRWRAIADRHDALLLGEVYLLEGDRLLRYVAADDGLHLAFWFGPLYVGWDATGLRRSFDEGVRVAAAARAGLGWVLGSHDRNRVASRLGEGAVGRSRAVALVALQVFAPGVPFLYQGEELGLGDPVIPPEAAQDPIAARQGEHARTRDVARTPMPWTPAPGLGFTAAGEAWLPFGDRGPGDTAEVQAADPDSPLSTYRRLLALRRALGGLAGAPFAWVTEDGPLLAARRGDVVVAVNTGESPMAVPGATGEVRFCTDRSCEGDAAEGFELGSDQAAVLG